MLKDRDTGILMEVVLDRRHPHALTQGLLPSTWMACSPVPTLIEQWNIQAAPSECLVSVVAIIRCLYMCGTAYRKGIDQLYAYK